MEKKSLGDDRQGDQPVRMLLLAEPGPAREAYERAATSAGADCFPVENLREMYERLHKESCSGLLIDVPTLIKAPGEHKRLAHSILEHYPVLRLRFDANTGTIHGLFYGQGEQVEDVVADFVAVSSATFPPRCLRSQDREPVAFNVRIHREPPGNGEKGERAVTINVSPGGCFLYTCSVYAENDVIWLDFLEFADRTPIMARLRWSVEWGKKMALPGIGVSFESLTPAQQREIAAWLGPDGLARHHRHGMEQ